MEHTNSNQTLGTNNCQWPWQIWNIFKTILNWSLIWSTSCSTEKHCKLPHNPNLCLTGDCLLLCCVSLFQVTKAGILYSQHQLNWIKDGEMYSGAAQARLPKNGVKVLFSQTFSLSWKLVCCCKISFNLRAKVNYFCVCSIAMHCYNHHCRRHHYHLFCRRCRHRHHHYRHQRTCLSDQMMVTCPSGSAMNIHIFNSSPGLPRLSVLCCNTSSSSSS